MLFADGGLAAILLVVWVFALLDVITSDEAAVRNLPKGAWILLVLFTFEIGAVVWFAVGRPVGPARSLPYKGNTGRIPPEYDRPGRAAAQNPDDDAAYLAQLRERAEEQRRRAAEERKRRLADDGEA